MSTAVRYFTSTKFSPPALLRRQDFVDEAFVDGAWRPTKAIVDHLFGNDDFVTEVDERAARDFAPAAFRSLDPGWRGTTDGQGSGP